MKKNYVNILLAFALAFIFAGCEKIEKEKTTDSRREIKLSKQLATVDATTPDQIHIISGNGGYKIIFPKKISIGEKYIGYSDKILEVRIDEEDNIIIKRKLPLEKDNEMLSGTFMITDSKGAKRLFIVDPRNIAGNLYDFDELEQKLQENPNYWQK